MVAGAGGLVGEGRGGLESLEGSIVRTVGPDSRLHGDCDFRLLSFPSFQFSTHAALGCIGLRRRGDYRSRRTGRAASGSHLAIQDASRKIARRFTVASERFSSQPPAWHTRRGVAPNRGRVGRPTDEL